MFHKQIMHNLAKHSDKKHPLVLVWVFYFFNCFVFILFLFCFFFIIPITFFFSGKFHAESLNHFLCSFLTHQFYLPHTCRVSSLFSNDTFKITGLFCFVWPNLLALNYLPRFLCKYYVNIYNRLPLKSQVTHIALGHPPFAAVMMVRDDFQHQKSGQK